MNTGDAIKVLLDAGYITKEEAGKIESNAKNRKQEKIEKAREVAVRALVDYLCAMCDKTPREEHTRFVRALFKELEADMIETPKKEEEEDPIKAFLKAIGAA